MQCLCLRNTELVSSSISDGPDGGQAPFWGHLQHVSVNIHGVYLTKRHWSSENKWRGTATVCVVLFESSAVEAKRPVKRAS